MGPVGRASPSTFERVPRVPPTFENCEANKSPKCTPFGIKCSKLRRLLGLRPRPRWGKLTTLPLPSIVVRSSLPSAISPLCTINARILRGSDLAPTDFVIAISSLKRSVYGENRLTKYADDCYLLVPASCIDSTISELDHISKWASIRNL